jgi:hypothetical protein
MAVSLVGPVYCMYTVVWRRRAPDDGLAAPWWARCPARSVGRDCCLRSPQHICSSLILDVGGRRRRRPFEQHCSRGQSGPEDGSLAPRLAERIRKGAPGPETEAGEAIEQLTPDGCSRPVPQTRDDAPRSILGLEKVRGPPSAQRAQNQLKVVRGDQPSSSNADVETVLGVVRVPPIAVVAVDDRSLVSTKLELVAARLRECPAGTGCRYL